MNIIPESTHLHIGSLIFPKLDQTDFTGPFEIFSRIPDSTYHIIGRETKPIRDVRGLILVPEKTFSEVPPLDLLHIPGGAGQEMLMDDEVTLSFVREQAVAARYCRAPARGSDRSRNPARHPICPRASL
jgi:cyclohexyl-isocyanide hydratase